MLAFWADGIGLARPRAKDSDSGQMVLPGSLVQQLDQLEAAFPAGT